MIHSMNEMLSEILKERSLDWRSCYTRVVSRPPEGRTVVCECSDSQVLDDLRRRMDQAGWGGEQGRIVYEALPSGDVLPAGMIAANSVADVRRAPAHAAELVTQVVYGDPVVPLKTDGDWYLARLDDGYIGWINSWHLCELSIENQKSYNDGAQHRVATNHAVVLKAPEPESLPVTDLVIGTPLQVDDSGKRGWRAIRLPDGKEGFAVSRSIEKRPVRKWMSRDGLSSTGMRFLGIPYIWGGSTPKGFDCSGLIQRIFRLHGLVLPRDTDLQARCGRDRRVNQKDFDADGQKLAVGDLMFFGKTAAKITHVAMILQEGLFLHAFGQVRVGSLDPRSHLFDPQLVNDWQITRDVVTHYNK